MITPATRTYSGIRDAINIVSSLGGGTVLLENGDYVDDGSGPIIIPTEYIQLQGSGKSRIMAPVEGAMNIFNTAVHYGSQVFLTQNEPTNTNILHVNNASEFKKGGFVRIQKKLNDLCQWSQISYVRSVNGNHISITPIVPYAINLTDHYDIYPVYLMKGIAFKNIIFEGNYNSSNTRALCLLGLRDAVFEDLYFYNFVGAAPFLIEMGFGNVVRNVYLENSGSMAECDFKFSYQTNGTVSDIRSVSSSGFGPQYIRCNFCTSTNINILSAAGRGLKLMGTLNCLFTNVFSHDNGSTGLAICFGTKNNQFVNCSALHHQGHNPDNSDGLWTSGHDNSYNLISSSTFFDSRIADLFVDPLDHHNTIVDCEYDKTWVGCCACPNNKIYPSVEKCWIVRCFEYCFGNCCSTYKCCCAGDE